MCKLVTFGLLCVAALVVAAHSREDHAFAKVAGWTVLGNWALFVMPWVYNPLSIAHLLKIAGLPVVHEDAWALTDLASIFIIGYAGRYVWWSPIIWSLHMSMLAMLSVAWANSLEYIQYSAVLDACLIVQLAVLFLVGGEGCADRLSDCWRDIRRMGGPAGTSTKAFSAREAAE